MYILIKSFRHREITGNGHATLKHFESVSKFHDYFKRPKKGRYLLEYQMLHETTDITALCFR